FNSLEERPFHVDHKRHDSDNSVAPAKLGPRQIGKNEHYQGIEYYDPFSQREFLKEHMWYPSSEIKDPYQGQMSRLAKKLPPEKQRILFNTPPPTGFHSVLFAFSSCFFQKIKLVWLKTLYELAQGELRDLRGQGYDVDEDGNVVSLNTPAKTHKISASETKISEFNPKQENSTDVDEEVSDESESDYELEPITLKHEQHSHYRQRTFSKKDLDSLVKALQGFSTQI
ncbi:hypothetical protein RFI_06312, partial [Reticulomyxa filosa]